MLGGHFTLPHAGLSEQETKFFISDPWDRDVDICEAGGDQKGIVGAFLESNRNLFGIDLDHSRCTNEITKDMA